MAVIVTAWDMLDSAASAAGPRAYIEKEYPLFAGRLKDTEKLEVSVFGVSVVGGDLNVDKEFREGFLKGELQSAGYVVTEDAIQKSDMTLPLAWLVKNTRKTP